MPNSKPLYRRGVSGEERYYSKGKLVQQKSMSFHGRGSLAAASALSSSMERLHRPRTVPDLLLSRSGSSAASSSSALTAERKPKLTKLLLNVTIQGSLGAVQVLMTLDSTVGDLISAAVKQYAKEGRRPVLLTSDSSVFDLHYSQFSLESLDRTEKLSALGSRNFFLCKRKEEVAVDSACSGGGEGDSALSTRTSCSKEADKVTKSGFSALPWLKFMNFLQ